MKPLKIGLIGLGNAGSQLARALHRKHLGIQAVFTRDKKKADRIGKRMRIYNTNDLLAFPKGLDLYIIAVPDRSIIEVAEKIEKVIGSDAPVVHISGAQSSKVLAPFFNSYGVFYPLQTMTKGRNVKFRDIPICIEASDKQLESMLLELARGLTDSVHFINDEERAWLHVAAVMVNNFSNHLFDLAEKITNDQALSFNLLRPLILETAKKVQTRSPKDCQTGPAARGDEVTVQKHLTLLQKYPEMSKLYEVLSSSLKGNS